MLSLLNEPSSYRQPPTSFLASILIHGAIVALAYLVILYAPRVDTRRTVRYDMRQLELHTPESSPSRLAAGAIGYPGPLSAQRSLGTMGDEAAHRPSPMHIPHTKIGPQTLIQPDLQTSLALDKEIPLPRALLWSPSKTVVKKIVGPQPQKPPSADVTPSLDMPNQEVTLASIPLASTSKLVVHELAPASNTTPVVNRQPSNDIQVVPVTTSQAQLQPTAAAVMSLSDIRMNDANVSLPPVNQTAPGDASGSTDAGNRKPAPGPGNENAAEKALGNGNAKTSGNHPGAGTTNSAALAGTGAGDSPTPSSGAGKSPQPGGGGKESANGPGPSQGGLAGAGLSDTAGNGTGIGGRQSATKIALPPDGRFGAVVVGTSLEDRFPEMGGVWHGRLAYTVYLHVGLAKSWVLQYALPRIADAAEAGSVGQIDAPWPFSIVRPNLAPGAIESDALLVHGFINTAGRFENLEVVFPPAFPLADFVLQSLSQWQFRPAAQNGKPIRTEVMIVIPEVDD
jgi:hypothetical protein